MKAYKICSAEEYQVFDGDRKVLDVEYNLAAYYDGESKADTEKVYLHSSGLNLTVVTEKGKISKFTDPAAGEKLDDKVLAAIEELPGHVKQPTKMALGK